MTRVLHRWAIRCDETGGFFPDTNGLSYSEPEPINPDVGVKLYRTERAAKNAIAQWRRGRHKPVYNALYGDLTKVVINPVEGRAERSLSAVPVRIIIGD